MTRDKDGFVIVPCPFCKVDTRLSYEENRVYKCECSSCDETLTVTRESMYDAYWYFKSLRICHQSYNDLAINDEM